MKKSGLFIMAICLLSMAACKSTRLTSSWKTPDAKLQPDKKIMVVALVPKQERKLRILMEDNLVSELKKEGYNAVSAFATDGPDNAMNGKDDEKAALQKYRNSDVAQVMTVAMVDKSRQRSYTPGYGYPYYGMPYYRGWYGGMYGPGYYQVNVRYQWEANLYDLNEKKLLYNAESDSVDPPTAYRQAYLYARQIVKDLQKQQLIAKS